MVLARRALMPEAQFDRYLAMQARLVSEVRATARRVKERASVEAVENAATWRAIGALAPAGVARRFLPVLLPSGPQRRTALDPGRREAHREHLTRIVAAAAAMPAAPVPSAAAPLADAPTAPTPPLAAHLCGMCGGGCCVRGGDTAYLTPATVRRYMDRHPELAPAAVQVAYLSRVHDRTEAGSCIHHTARGCALPRDMRSDTCNQFMCTALSAVQAARGGRRPIEGVIAVRRRLDVWSRDSLLAPNDVTGLAVITDAGASALPMVRGPRNGSVGADAAPGAGRRGRPRARR
jgi:hypothetical protein